MLETRVTHASAQWRTSASFCAEVDTERGWRSRGCGVWNKTVDLVRLCGTLLAFGVRVQHLFELVLNLME